MKKILFTFSTILISLVGCKQTEPFIISNNDTKFNEAPTIQYYLPSNIYRIQIKVLRTQFFKGPYVDFANNYLRINRNVIQFNETKYTIHGVHIDLEAIADPNEKYAINLNKNSSIPISLTREGILSGINTQTNKSLTQLSYEDDIPTQQNFVFTDLSTSPIVDIKENITYKYKKIDSSLVRVPVRKAETEVQNFQQLAWAAAKFISTIRESRFRLLAGISEIDQIPENVKNRVKELNTLEKKYLALFIGHKITDTLIYNFHYTPALGIPQEQQKDLALFSKTKGIQRISTTINDVAPHTNNKTTIKIKCRPLLITETSNKNAISQIKNKGIVYRIPSQAEFSISINNKIYGTTRLPISQWGTYAYLPTSIFNYKNKIEFDIYTGNIQQITTNEQIDTEKKNNH